MGNLIARNAEAYERIKMRLRDAVPVSSEWKMAASHTAGRLHQKYVQDFVFIHINKCGGTSLERALGVPLLNHDTALERRAVLGPRVWEKRFKFTLVRHPYDRFLSKYFYDLPAKDAETLTRNFPGYVGRQEALHADALTGRPPGALQRRGARLSASERKIYWLRHSLPMSWWVCDETGQLMVDEVFRLEDLDGAAERLSEKLGRRISIPRLKQNTKRYSRGTLLESREIRERIYRLLERDFALFGYDPELD